MPRTLIVTCAVAALAACAPPSPEAPDDPRAAQERAQEPSTSGEEVGQADGADRGASSQASSVDASSENADPVPPPQAAPPGDDGVIGRDYLAGPWVARGGDCAKPAFDVAPVPGAGPMSIETSIEGAPRTGSVRTGADAGFVFDQPERVFGIEKRRAQSLAVFPPERGAVELGGVMIEGDGVVFIKCAEEFAGSNG